MKHNQNLIYMYIHFHVYNFLHIYNLLDLKSLFYDISEAQTILEDIRNINVLLCVSHLVFHAVFVFNVSIIYYLELKLSRCFSSLL